MTGLVYARIVCPHADLGPEDTYHEWVTLEYFAKVKADRLGRPNDRMRNAEWTRWVCNNRSCGGSALVSDAASLRAIEEAESG